MKPLRRRWQERARAPRRPAALLLCVWVSGCVGGDPPAGPPIPSRLQRPVGEPINGLPSYSERTAHHMTNRVRVGFDCGDPTLVCNGAPLPPLAWSHELGLAARFHSQHMHDAECFQHPSCCNLVDVGGTLQCDGAGYTCPGGQCDYTPDCPGTSAQQRVFMFGSSYSGENIAGGHGTGEGTICQWYESPGHHDNLCNPMHGAVGVGHFSGPNCQSYVWGHYWTQDFAPGSSPDGILSGSHWGAGASTTFGAAFHDPGAAGPPQQADVVIDGVCHPLTREHGDDESSSWAALVAAGSGCSSYWFLIYGADGTRWAYPTTGSYRVGSGCTDEYTATQDAADCEGPQPECTDGAAEGCYDGPTGTSGVGECADGTRTCSQEIWGPCQGQALPTAELCNGLDDDCDGTADEGCVQADGGLLPDSGLASDGGGNEDAAATADASPGNPDSDAIHGGCGCRAAPGGVFPALPLLLWLLARRRRFVP